MPYKGVTHNCRRCPDASQSPKPAPSPAQTTTTLHGRGTRRTCALPAWVAQVVELPPELTSPGRGL